MINNKIDNGRERAQKWFAKANGWRVSWQQFGLKTLVRGGSRGEMDYFDPFGDVLIDHREFYKKDNRAVAIVGHNYRLIEETKAVAAEHGLAVHVGTKDVSWYYPGGATPIVVTHVGVEIIWPTPEQVLATTLAYKEYHAEQLRLWEKTKERIRQRELENLKREKS